MGPNGREQEQRARREAIDAPVETRQLRPLLVFGVEGEKQTLI